APFTAAGDQVGVKAGDRFSPELYRRLLAEEYEKLRNASNRDVHDASKGATLPIAREIVEVYVTDGVKLPWYIDLLNINLGNHDLTEAKDGFGCSWMRFAGMGPGSPRTWTSGCPVPRQALVHQGDHLVQRVVPQPPLPGDPPD